MVQRITLSELQRIKQWHVDHRDDHPLEYQLWDGLLTLWLGRRALPTNPPRTTAAPQFSLIDVALNVLMFTLVFIGADYLGVRSGAVHSVPLNTVSGAVRGTGADSLWTSDGRGGFTATARLKVLVGE